MASTERRGRRQHRTFSVVAPMIFVGALALAFSLVSGTNRQTLWEVAFRPTAAIEVEYYESIGEMAAAADVVAIGQIVEITPGREFGEGEELLHYAAARVQVHELIRSTAPVTGDLIWEIPLTPGLGAKEAAELNAEIPREPLLLFLRNKATDLLRGGIGDPQVERSFYRTVVSGAVFANVDGRARLPILPIESLFIDEFAGAKFDDLVLLAEGRTRDAGD